MMNIKTWKLLGKPDQDTWDKMTEEGKNHIVTYTQNRGNPKDGNTQPLRQVHLHDIIYLECDEKGPSIEVSTHQLKTKKKVHCHSAPAEKEAMSLIDMATNKNARNNSGPIQNDMIANDKEHTCAGFDISTFLHGEEEE